MPPPPGRSKKKDYGAIIMPPYDLISWGVLRWGEYIWTSMIDDFRMFPDSANHIDYYKGKLKRRVGTLRWLLVLSTQFFSKNVILRIFIISPKMRVKVIETT